MATEKRLIDANRLKMRMIAFATAIKREYLSIEAIVDTINTEYTVDAVEVVRCKDCFANGCCSVQIDLDMGDKGYCSKGRKEN